MPNTFNDFWKMIWEQNCSIIVMITNVREKGRVRLEYFNLILTFNYKFIHFKLRLNVINIGLMMVVKYMEIYKSLYYTH